MDCGHGWRNDNDCDVCRPPAIVVAGLRGRISELEVALREIAEAVRDVGIAVHMSGDPTKAYGAMMEKWPRLTNAQSAAIDLLSSVEK